MAKSKTVKPEKSTLKKNTLENPSVSATTPEVEQSSLQGSSKLENEDKPVKDESTSPQKEELPLTRNRKKTKTTKKSPKLVDGLPKKLKGIEAMGIQKEKDYFVENLSILYASGMNIVEALECIKSGLKSKPLVRTVEALKESINRGTPIWKALEATGLLPDHMIALLKVGEESGKLPENLRVIVEQQQKERVFRSRIKSAMMYPVLLLGIAVVLGLGLSYFILPNLINVFTQMDMELPFITRMMIAFSEFLQNYGYIAVPVGFAVSILSFLILFSFEKTKHLGQGLLLITPIVKNLIIETEVARFGYILGTLLNAGLPIVKALNSLSQTTSYKIYRKLYLYFEKQTEQGKSLKQSFESFKRSTKYIPLPVQHMVMASEQSGKLPETLMNIGDIFEDKTETTTKNFTVVLEPLMLVVVWGVVMIVALGVIQPIYGLTGGFNKSIETSDSSQISLDTETDSDIEKKDYPKLKVKENDRGYIYVYELPETSSNIINQADVEDELEYADTEEGWYKIVRGIDEFGWVKKEDVEEINQ
jgi:type IV pilus assembly protein PilC